MQILQFVTVAQPSPFVIVADTTAGGVATTLSAVAVNLVMLLLTGLVILV